MSRLIVVEFTSLDGVMHDPDGSDGSPQGGWVFRYGPEAVANDPFGLGEVLDTGALLLGRRTWELLAKVWPGRNDPFSAKMNAMPKLVVSRSLDHATDWQNSAVLQDDLVDEYRLMVFPLVLGEGTRVFPDGAAPVSLSLVSAQAAGPRVRLTYARDAG